MSNSYGFKEEVANAISHGVGLILGIVGLVLLLVKAVDHQADALTITSMSIYGGSMIALFLASTLYHAIPYRRAKRWLKTFDHCAIYLLIAGSYTPFLLVSLINPIGGWIDDRYLVASLDWHPNENRVCLPLQKALASDLSDHGLAFADCDLSVGDSFGCRWFKFISGWWVNLFAGRDFLCGQTDPLQSCHLACFCTGGVCVPFRSHLSVC